MLNCTITGFSDEISDETEKQFRELNKLGIKYFEPRGINGKNISLLTADEAEKLKSQMDRSGIKVSSIGSPIGKIDITDDFDAHMELLKNVINTAKILDCKFIRVFSFFIKDGEFKKHRSEVIRRMKAMTALAEKNGVVLLHENEKEIYGDIPSRCLDVLESVNSDSLRAVFDPANFVQCGAVTYPDGFKLLKDYVVYMHIKDALADGRVVPSGYGIGHVKEILQYLSDINYTGFLSLEPHLGSFSGLESLELGDEMQKLEKSDASTFEIAYNALLNIIREIK